MAQAKKWELAAPITAAFEKEHPEFDSIVLQLLHNRNLTEKEDIQRFLYPDFEQHLHDPFIFVEMEKAVDRIIGAIERGEKILIYGDYDADGVSSSTLMVSSLRMLGADVDVYIPHREIEGYGLGEKSVAHIIEQQFCLVITVDCAISNKVEVEQLQEKGIDVIVTDHHSEPRELPNAYALINPQLSRESYPFKKLAGVGVAYKVMQALFAMLEKRGIYLNSTEFEKYGGYAGYIKWLLDVVSLGTVADCMPLLDENRVFIKYGLKVLAKTRRLGLRELMNHAGITPHDVQTYHIGFQIAPRINAAGRLDHANVAYELLMSEDTQHACDLSEQLNETNKERQYVTEEILQEIKAMIPTSTDDSVILARGADWQGGVVGLVAGKLVEHYNKPVMVMTEAKGEISGSGRSLPAFNMVGALQEIDHLFSAYGGHKMACGFTLKDNAFFDEFKTEMNKLAAAAMKDADMTPIVQVDSEVTLAQVDWDLLGHIDLFRPFGYGNSEPNFIIRGLEVHDFGIIGRADKHLRLTFRDGRTFRKAIAFGFGPTWGHQLQKGDTVDIVCNLSVNEWNGNREIQLKLVDMKFA
jgi:single-stranded-DNA-specific exonuclease